MNKIYFKRINEHIILRHELKKNIHSTRFIMVIIIYILKYSTVLCHVHIEVLGCWFITADSRVKVIRDIIV